MKIIIMMMLMVASYSFACPNLAGTYRCYDENGQPETSTITQRNVNGHMAYTMQGEESFEIIADNQTRTMDTGDDAMANATYQASCSGDKLYISMKSDVYDQGQKIGHAAIEMNVELENNNLRSTQSGTIFTEFGDFPIPPSTDVCARI